MPKQERKTLNLLYSYIRSTDNSMQEHPVHSPIVKYFVPAADDVMQVRNLENKYVFGRERGPVRN